MEARIEMNIIHIVRDLAMLLRHRSLRAVGGQNPDAAECLKEHRALLDLWILLVQLGEIGHMCVPGRYVDAGGANCVGVDVFPLDALRVGKEPEEGRRGEILSQHVGVVCDNRIIECKRLDKLPALSF